ncbi:MAG: hypothetical protein GF344_16160 [Chitinivibrionales bacterium]|nr:hypothetical protein [Chitinivibrionales bacterium]MBD3358228.1 hypothetical protein [Chitinivibrionales bacterium]
MPSKVQIEAEIARLRKLPSTPARMREIQALERCLGKEMHPARKSEKSTGTSKKSPRKGPKVLRKRLSSVEDDDNDADTTQTKRRGSDFNAKNYLGDLLGSHHKGMS